MSVRVLNRLPTKSAVISVFADSFIPSFLTWGGAGVKGYLISWAGWRVGAGGSQRKESPINL